MFIIYPLLCILKDIKQVYFQINIWLVIGASAYYGPRQYKSSITRYAVSHSWSSYRATLASLSQKFTYIPQEWFHEPTLISIY